MSAETEELYSLLIPLSEDRLLVPRACVAEVVRYTEADKNTDAHPWLLGRLTWNGRRIPIVAFEGALGREPPPVTGRTRIVVFHASSGELKSGFFGVMTQGFPQLVRVNRDVLKLHTTDGWPDGAPVFCRVKMINEFPLIPNLEDLEIMLARESLAA